MFNKFTTAGISHPAQGSAEFDGSSDYIDTGEPFSLNEITISSWFYANNDGNYKTIFDNRDGSGDGMFLTIGISEDIIFQTNGTTLFSSTNGYSSEWFYLSATWDGSTMKLYIDGSLLDTKSSSVTIDVTTSAKIGRAGYTSASYFNGNLANVAIWNRALTSDEINSVMWKGYQSLTSTEQSGLQAWYSLDDVASPAASLATMEALAVDKDATIENKAAITAAVNALS